MPSQPPYIGKDFRMISGKFKYKEDHYSLTFNWDRAAIGRDGSIRVIEDELSCPVPLHIHGHIARAAYMNSTEDFVQKLVWIVKKKHFRRLWKIAESWRHVLRKNSTLSPPPCEYWTPSKDCLGISKKDALTTFSEKPINKSPTVSKEKQTKGGEI